MRFILVVALLTFFAGCGVSIHPVPGVSIHIPIPHDSDQHDRDDNHQDRD